MTDLEVRLIDSATEKQIGTFSAKTSSYPNFMQILPIGSIFIIGEQRYKVLYIEYKLASSPTADPEEPESQTKYLVASVSAHLKAFRVGFNPG